MDDEKTNQDELEDEGSQVSSEAEKQSSQKPPKLTKEQEAEVQKRVSDALSKRGDKAKELEERLKIIEADNKALKDEKFAIAANKYGLEVEKLKEAGITDPSKIEAYANLFGRTQEKEAGTLSPQPQRKVDSAKSVGGGLDWRNLPPDEKVRYALENPKK